MRIIFLTFFCFNFLLSCQKNSRSKIKIDNEDSLNFSKKNDQFKKFKASKELLLLENLIKKALIVEDNNEKIILKIDEFMDKYNFDNEIKSNVLKLQILKSNLSIKDKSYLLKYYKID